MPQKPMFLFLVPFVLVSQVFARVINVPQEYATIQGAIDTAEDGDEIVIAPGTYFESTIRFNGKAIIVRGTDPQDSTIVKTTVVDGDSMDTVFCFDAQETNDAVLSGLTITNGNGWVGGGIRCNNQSSPTIRNCRIINNASEAVGGGFYSLEGTPILINCVIANNVAGGRGGGINIQKGFASLENCAITDNISAAWGGGISCLASASMSVINCQIIRNTAKEFGGGVGTDRGSFRPDTLKFHHCVISENSTDGWGGGIDTEAALTRLEHCLIQDNNSQKDGGGIVCGFRSIEISHCEVTGNISGYRGGGVQIGMFATGSIENTIIADNESLDGVGGLDLFFGPSITVTQCTIVRNIGGGEPTWGGGIYLGYADASITNSILWDNTPLDLFVEGSEVIVSYTDIGGGWPGFGNISEDPNLTSFKGYTELLDPASPCIDAGDPLVYDGVFDKHPRWPNWYPNRARSDMGAYGGPKNGHWLRQY